MSTTPDRRVTYPWLFLLGIVVFGCALMMKWMKWPGGSVSLIIGAGLATVGAFLNAGPVKERVAVIAMRLTIAAVVTYTMWRLLYWPGSVVVALAAVVFGLSAFVLWRQSERAHTGTFAAMVVVLLFGGALMATPVHALYHYMFFRTPGAQRFMHNGVGHWYRYSWFLYQAGEREKSSAMLDSAAAEVRAYDARTGKNGEALLLKLSNTQEQIAADDWERFVELDQ